MATDNILKLTVQQGLLPISAAVGVEALLQLLAAPPAPVVTVCPLDVARLPATLYFAALRPGSGGVGPAAVGQSGPPWIEALRAEPAEVRRAAIWARLEEVAQASGVPRLEGSTVWGEAGLDSLGMVEVRNGLARAFENAVPLGATALF
eukprot:EG_transcript_41602